MKNNSSYCKTNYYCCCWLIKQRDILYNKELPGNYGVLKILNWFTPYQALLCSKITMGSIWPITYIFSSLSLLIWIAKMALVSVIYKLQQNSKFDTTLHIAHMYLTERAYILVLKVWQYTSYEIHVCYPPNFISVQHPQDPASIDKEIIWKFLPSWNNLRLVL